MLQDSLIIQKEAACLFKENVHRLLQFWLNNIKFEAIQEEELIAGATAAANDDNSDLWVTLFATNQINIDKAKKYIKSITETATTIAVEIDEELKTCLDENRLIEKHQVHFFEIENKTLIQGSIDDVEMALKELKCSTEVNSETANEPTSLLGSTSDNDSIEDINFVIEKQAVSQWKIAESKKSNKQKNKQENADSQEDVSGKRFIVIDGSNVARSHAEAIGNKNYFSCKGIQLAVEFFVKRGHKDIVVLVPEFRRNPSLKREVPSLYPEILDDLKEKGYLTYTPSPCYDDRVILEAAESYNAVIVSKDKYRDICKEKPNWERLVKRNLLSAFSFVKDTFIITNDPFGRKGPSLDAFLSNKFIKKVNNNYLTSNDSNRQSTLTSQESNDAISIESNANKKEDGKKSSQETQRDEQTTNKIFDKLIEIFPESGDLIIDLLNKHPCRTDINFFVQNL